MRVQMSLYMIERSIRMLEARWLALQADSEARPEATYLEGDVAKTEEVLGTYYQMLKDKKGGR